MLGIAAAAHANVKAVTWEKPFTPCAQKKSVIVHMTRRKDG